MNREVRMIKRLLPAFLIFLPLLVLCSDNRSPNSVDTEELKTDSPAGTWESTFPSADDTTLDSRPEFMITMRYAQGPHRYFIDVAELDGGKILFESLGDWQLSGDSVILTGSSCKSLNTSSTLLEPMPDSVCARRAGIRAPTSETKWHVPLGSFAPAILDAFGIAENHLSLVAMVSLTFTRVGATATIPEPGVEEGDWSVSLPADTLGNTIRTDLMLNPNKSFEMTLEHSEYPSLLFTQTGTYSTDEKGSVIFYPEACSGLDSASGELVPIVDSLCTTGFTIPGPDSGSSWRISGADLGPLLNQLPLSDDTKRLLHYISLDFEKNPE